MVSEEKKTLNNYTHYLRFLRELKQFHRFNDDYFTDASEIDYRGDTLDIYLKGRRSNARISKHTDFNENRCNAKLCFIPSERNILSAIQHTDRVYRSNNMDLLFNYIFEWAETHGLFTSESPKKLSFDERIEYYYDVKRERDTIRLNRTDGKTEFVPFYASSGVQSALPLEVMVDYITGMVGQPVDVSQKWLTDFIRDYMVGHKIERESLLDDALLNHILIYQYANLFIEEPEQNLFPESQWNLLCHIVSRITKRTNESRCRNSLVLTTHSPYILSALNLLIKADKAIQTDREKTSELLPCEVNLPLSSVSAYYISEGHLINLIDKDAGMINGNTLDGVSDYMEDINSGLNDIIYGD